MAAIRLRRTQALRADAGRGSVLPLIQQPDPGAGIVLRRRAL
jgi:hypothetical protein